MAFCEWDDSYSVNVPEADRQHQRLFALINQLHEGMTNTRKEATVDYAVDELDTIESVLEELVDYTVHHFSTEERYMLEHAYPGYPAHKKAHRHFVDRVRRFQRDFEHGEAICSIEIIQFLKDWLENHIRTLDKRLGAFLSAQHAVPSSAPNRAVREAIHGSLPPMAARDRGLPQANQSPQVGSDRGRGGTGWGDARPNRLDCSARDYTNARRLRAATAIVPPSLAMAQPPRTCPGGLLE